MREDLMRSTNDAHSDIRASVGELLDIARNIHYLHPEMSQDIALIARHIRYAAEKIQDNASEALHDDLRYSRESVARIFTALLDRAGPAGAAEKIQDNASEALHDDLNHSRDSVTQAMRHGRIVLNRIKKVDSGGDL